MAASLQTEATKDSERNWKGGRSLAAHRGLVLRAAHSEDTDTLSRVVVAWCGERRRHTGQAFTQNSETARVRVSQYFNQGEDTRFQPGPTSTKRKPSGKACWPGLTEGPSGTGTIESVLNSQKCCLFIVSLN